MSASDVLAIVGIAVSVIGIPLAFFLARRSRRRPHLRYVVDFDLVVSPALGSFNSGFLRTPSGTPVTQISRTFIAMWNHQGDTIRGIDILPDDRLRIQLGGQDRALFVRVASRSRSQNKLVASVDPDNESAVVVDFDFLDSGDGGVVEVIHQGSGPPRIAGTVRGADISSSGEADLRPEVLERISGGSWLAALRARASPFFLLLAVILITAGVVSLAGIAARLFQPDRGPKLVDSATFDLGTLAGQRGFADQVQAEGIRDDEPLAPIMLYVVFPIVILGGFLTVFSVLRFRYPSSIAREIDFHNATE